MQGSRGQSWVFFGFFLTASNSEPPPAGSRQDEEKCPKQHQVPDQTGSRSPPTSMPSSSLKSPHVLKGNT